MLRPTFHDVAVVAHPARRAHGFWSLPRALLRPGRSVRARKQSPIPGNNRACRARPGGSGGVMRRMTCVLTMLALISVTAVTASAAPFFFSTGAPDGRLGAASRPESHKKIEIEAADDFVLSAHTVLHQATFTGLLNQGGQGEIREVRVEIYRVFPNDSNVARTSGPPTFSTTQVPTRVNSPSDVAFDSRESGSGLTFTSSVLSAS